MFLGGKFGGNCPSSEIHMAGAPDIACAKGQRSLVESVALKASVELLYRSQVCRAVSAAVCGC